MNAIDDDKLSKAASGLVTEISPERDLWPAIEDAINKPKRSRWTPMLAQAAAVVLIVGAASLLTYVAVKYDNPEVAQVAPMNLVFERTAFGGEYTFASVYGGPAEMSRRDSIASWQNCRRKRGKASSLACP